MRDLTIKSDSVYTNIQINGPKYWHKRRNMVEQQTR